MPVKKQETSWRATGSYLPSSILHPALVDETRRFLLTYARLGDLAATSETFVNNDLPQRSRSSRLTMAKAIGQRLERWNPPDWVWRDLASFAQDDVYPSLQAALLLHLVRQDALLYDFVQQVIVPRWSGGERLLARPDVQGFLDKANENHPEIDGWTHKTREKAASNTLTILRDLGLLRGKLQKQIVEPIVPPAVAAHLVKLLQEEGLAKPEIAEHSDWHIWLWDAQRVRAFVNGFVSEEAPA